MKIIIGLVLTVEVDDTSGVATIGVLLDTALVFCCEPSTRRLNPWEMFDGISKWVFVLLGKYAL